MNLAKKTKYILAFAILFCSACFGIINASNRIYQNGNTGPGFSEVETVESVKYGTQILTIASDSKIYVHDGIAYTKGEDKGRFSLSGYCACTKCSSGTGITYSGKPVRENHTVAADKKVLPIGTVLILENAEGKDGQIYDGVYVVEDIGGGVKNNHLDIYRPDHNLAALVTYYGRAYGNVYLAVPYVATESNADKEVSSDNSKKTKK